MSKAIFIDAENEVIQAVECDDSLKFLQSKVKGSIEWAWTFKKDQETLYVNEEGMYLFAYGFHLLQRPDQPMFGNGLVVGREIHREHADVSPEVLAMLRRTIKFWRN